MSRKRKEVLFSIEKKKMSDSEGESYEKQVKIVLVGDGSAGKTSISERFSKDAFNRDYNQTLGIDYYLKRINLTRIIRLNSSQEEKNPPSQ